MTEFIHKVTKEDEGMEVREIMRTYFDFSARLRNKIKREKLVMLNDEQTPGWIKPEVGDVIRIDLPEEKSHFEPQPIPLDPVYEDDDLLIINKQPGLIVHPTKGHPTGTVANALMYYMEHTGKPFKIRFVNRLDMDTSGLLVVAKNAYCQNDYTRQMKENLVQKRYLAIVKGILENDHGTIDLPIGRPDPENVARGVMEGGAPSVTHYTVRERFLQSGYTLVELLLETGRTHQIRVHLAQAGHPLWGDALYGPALSPAEEKAAPRQMLHAWKLEFRHPVTGRAMRFCCPPPADIPDCMAALSRRTVRLVLTGVAGCGKSSLLRVLGDAGVPTWSADAAVAALYAPGGDGWRILRGLYGDRFVAGDDSPVNKTALAAALAEEPGLRREIETAVHPMVFHALRTFFGKAEQDGAELAAAEVPLWHETRRAARSSGKNGGEEISVAVLCPDDARRERLRVRRGWSAERIALVDSWQFSQEDKAKASDFVVDNGGDEDALRAHGAELLLRAAARGAERNAALRAEWEQAWACPE